MKIYISIPISGHDLAAQRAKANAIADNLRKLGHEPVNPFDTPESPQGLSDKDKYAYYIGEDLKRLLTCDAVFLCNGWSESRGCRLEAQTALIYGLKQYGRFEDVPNENIHE